MQHSLKIKLTGTQPLLMSNGQIVDPLNEWTKLISQADTAMKGRNKTEARIIEADKLRWLGGVYQRDGYPYLPVDNFLGCLIKAGRLHKLGKKVESGVYVRDCSLLEFGGRGAGKKVEELVEMPEYAHRKATKRGVIAHRPFFENWSCEYELIYDDRIIDTDDFMTVLDTAGAIGIGAWSARFGKFETEIIEK